MTNICDVQIVKWIALAIMVVAIVVVLGYVLVKLIDAISNSCAESRKHKWEVENSNRKSRADLLYKKLELLKEKNDDSLLSAIDDELKNFKLGK